MERLELFDKYYNNLLSAQERADFDGQLKSDTAFEEEYQEFVDMQQFLVAKPQVDEGKALIQKLRTEYEGKTTSGPKKYSILIIIVGVILLMALFYFLKPKPVTSQSLYALYESPAAVSIGTRSGDAEIKIVDALSLFNDGQYATAYPLLDTLGLSANDIPFVLFAKGIAATRDVDVNEGRSILQRLANDYTAYANDANWNIALSHLNEGNVDQVRIYLERISEDSNLRDKVIGLLEGLEKI